jgi:hypothetical protein
VNSTRQRFFAFSSGLTNTMRTGSPMTEDHVFIDSLGHVVHGGEAVCVGEVITFSTPTTGHRTKRYFPQVTG